MAYVFQTRRPDGSFHKRWRFQFKDRFGTKRTATGTTSEAETVRLADQIEVREKVIRRGLLPAPKVSETPRKFEDVSKEYTEWGSSRGGRNGGAWGEVHLRMRRAHLAWWGRELRLENMSDLRGILPRVEKALRQLTAKGRSGKTLANYAEAIAAFCDWSVSRGYLGEDPLGDLTQVRHDAADP